MPLNSNIIMKHIHYFMMKFLCDTKGDVKKGDHEFRKHCMHGPSSLRLKPLFRVLGNVWLTPNTGEALIITSEGS